MFLSAAVTGRSTPDASAEGSKLMGHAGEAVTALGPTGVVLVDGRRYEAASRGGFIDRGERVVVRGGTNFQLIVEKSS
jgi:membrane-bound ClpP family serine protease